jgi:hypothetical protein
MAGAGAEAERAEVSSMRAGGGCWAHTGTASSDGKINNSQRAEIRLIGRSHAPEFSENGSKPSNFYASR